MASLGLLSVGGDWYAASAMSEGPSLSGFEIIPQVYYDLIARYIPGLFTVVVFCGLAGMDVDGWLNSETPATSWAISGLGGTIGPWFIGSILQVLRVPAFRGLGSAARPEPNEPSRDAMDSAVGAEARPARPPESLINRVRSRLGLNGPFDIAKETRELDRSMRTDYRDRPRIVKLRSEVRMWQAIFVGLIVSQSGLLLKLWGHGASDSSSFVLWAFTWTLGLVIALVVSLLGVSAAVDRHVAAINVREDELRKGIDGGD